MGTRTKSTGQIDYRLTYELQKYKCPRENKESTYDFVSVLLHYKNDLKPIEDLGFIKTSQAKKIVAGKVWLKDLEQIAAHPNVISIEYSRPLRYELDHSVCAMGVAALRSHSKRGKRGRGPYGRDVIIGIIDSGFDCMHPCFLDCKDNTRIISFWDQNANVKQLRKSNRSGVKFNEPKPFGYGVEYKREQIQHAITMNDPNLLPHKPVNSHGTHVAGIAAGNGKSVEGQTEYIGVAPKAELIFVAYNSSQNLGNSAYVLDAAKYIINKAKLLKKPVVINLSQGDSLGPHDGTSLLEQAIDNLLVEEGVAFVKSAGNEGQAKAHISGTVEYGKRTSIKLKVPKLGFNNSPDVNDDTIDIWYSGEDRFDVSIKPPGGTETSIVKPYSRVEFALPNRNEAFIRSFMNDAENHDNRISIILQAAKRGAVEDGEWEIVLHGRFIKDGKFHAWVDVTREDAFPTFPDSNNECTITIPGTSKKVITVASYYTCIRDLVRTINNTITNPAKRIKVDSLDMASGVGPIRKSSLDECPKPELVAPGGEIMSAAPGGKYEAQMGTSMAAPHVAGLIALLFEQNPKLTQDEIRKILLTSADVNNPAKKQQRKNSFTAKKIDAKAAFLALSTLKTTRKRGTSYGKSKKN